MVPMWMFPVALACGNAFILKPSERDPSAPLFIAELLAQAGVVGLAGYGWGAGLTALLGTILGNKTELAFFLPWWVLAGAGAAVVLICLASALLGILRVLLLEPAIVFKS